jgi:hypothetical protein
MAPVTVSGQVDWRDPPFVSPGMIRLSLDTQGRLIRFEAVAEAVVEEVTATEHSDADWSALFAAAGLDPASFTPVEPSWTPGVYCDTRTAWDGSYPEAPEYPLHIEAGSFGGRPVYFRMIGPWEEPPGSSSLFDTTGEKIGVGVFLTLFSVVPLGAGLIAFRHLKAGLRLRHFVRDLAIHRRPHAIDLRVGHAVAGVWQRRGFRTAVLDPVSGRRAVRPALLAACHGLLDATAGREVP